MQSHEQDWEALLKEQERFLAIGANEERERQGARAFRGPEPRLREPVDVNSSGVAYGDGDFGGSLHPRGLRSQQKHTTAPTDSFGATTASTAASPSVPESTDSNADADGEPEATEKPPSASVFCSHEMVDRGTGTSMKSTLKPMAMLKPLPMRAGGASPSPSGGLGRERKFSNQSGFREGEKKSGRHFTPGTGDSASSQLSGLPAVQHRSLGGPSLGRPRPPPQQALPTPEDLNKPNNFSSSKQGNSSPASPGQPGNDLSGRSRSGSSSSSSSSSSSNHDSVDESGDAANAALVASMSPEEVADALGELKGLFSDKALDFLRNRKKGDGPSSSSGGSGAQSNAGSASRAAAAAATSDSSTTSSSAASLAKHSPRPATMSAQVVSELAKGIIDDSSLHAAVASLPTSERAKHGWMADLDASSSTTSSTISKCSQTKATGLSSSSSPHLVGTLLGDAPETNDAGGQRFDLNGWPLLFPVEAGARTTADSGAAAGGEATARHSKSSAGGASEVTATEAKESSVPLHLGLHHHGQEPSHPGYTVDELCLLSRSLNSPQRALAANVLARALATTARVLRATSAAHARSQAFNGHPGTRNSGGVEGANEALLKQLRPLRVPVQLPSLCCQLLGDVSVAVRAAACLLAHALFDADSSSYSSSPPLESAAMDSSSHASATAAPAAAAAWASGAGAAVVPEPGLDAWRTHLAVVAPPLSPWRKLVSGQAALAGHATSNLRRLAWEHPQRLDEEERDDDDDEHARLVALAEEVVEQASSMHDDDDDFSSSSSDNNDVEVAGRVMRRVMNHVGDNSSTRNRSSPSGSVLGSAAAQRLIAFRHPIKPLIAADVGTSGEGDDCGDGSSSGNNDLIGRLVAVLLPNKHNNSDDNYSGGGGDGSGGLDRLPASAVAAALGALAGIASQSQAASERVARQPGLLDGLRRRFLEPSSGTASTITSQEPDKASQEEEAVVSYESSSSSASASTCWWWHAAAALRLLRVLCAGSRQVCLALAADGTLQAAKGFLALKPPLSFPSLQGGSDATSPSGPTPHQFHSDAHAASQRLRLACLESLRLWRVALAYGIDLESLPLVLQLAPPLEHSLQQMRLLYSSNQSGGGSSEYDNDDDDGEDSAGSSSGSSYFAGPSFGATVAVAVPMAARLAAIWGSSETTVAYQSSETQATATDAAVDPLMASLFWCLEEACIAWHALDERQGDADSDDARAVAGEEAAMDAQRAANLHGNNDDDDASSIGGGDVHERRAKQARAAAAMSGVAVPATTLAACGTALKEVAAAVRACLLASASSDSAMSSPLLPTKEASQLAGLRTCSALASFASTFTAVGLARASQRARLAALHPPSAAAFFVPPPPSQDDDVVGNGTGSGSISDSGGKHKAANEARVEVASAVGALLGASSESLEQFCRAQPNNLRAVMRAEGQTGTNVSALAAARAPVATALHAHAHAEVWREEASALADRAASLCRLWLCLWPQQGAAPTNTDGKSMATSGVGRLSLATLEVFVRRWDRFLRRLLDFDHLQQQPAVATSSVTSTTAASASSSSSAPSLSDSMAFRAPLAYRHGASGGSASSCRHRAAARALLLSASALVRTEVTAALSSAAAAASSAEPLLGCAAEWVALAVPLFEAGHEVEASQALQLYAQVRPFCATLNNTRRTSDDAGSDGGGDDSPLVPLTSALELSLEPLAQDARHSFHLLGPHPALRSSLSLCGAPLARESLQLLRHGQRQQVAVAAVLAAALAAHHARQQQQQQQEAAAQQAAAGMLPGGGGGGVAAPKPLPPPPLSAQLPLPPHWALLPLLSRPGPRSHPSHRSGAGASNSSSSSSSSSRRRETEVPGGCSADALWAALALARGLEASTTIDEEGRQGRTQGSQLRLTTSHMGSVPPAHKVAALLQLLVFDDGEDDDDDEHEVNSSSENGSALAGIFAPASTRVAFGRDVSALFDAWVRQALRITAASSSSSQPSSESTCLGLGFGAQLAAAAEAITPPSPMDRIEALAAAAASTGPSSPSEKALDVGTPLANRCLERTARHLINRFADHPPPLHRHNAQSPSVDASRTAAAATTKEEEEEEEANVNSTVRRALRSFLRTDVSSSVRSAVMRGLAQRQVLHLLAENWHLSVEADDEGDQEAAARTTAKALGGARAFLEPPDQDPDLLRAYAKAVSSLGHRRLTTSSAPTSAATTAESPSSRTAVSFLWQIVARHLTADAKALRALVSTATKDVTSKSSDAAAPSTAASSAVAAVPSWGRRQRLADLLSSTPPRTLAEVLASAPPDIRQAAKTVGGGETATASAGKEVGSQLAAYVSLEEALSAVATEKPALQPKVNQVIEFLKAGPLLE